MRAERELMRGAGPVVVLKLLERGPMYGYELVEGLAKRTVGVFNTGQCSLYPLLYNLEAKGLIEGYWQEAQNGRQRKYYKLTEGGRKRLASTHKPLRTLAQVLGSFGILGGSSASAVGGVR